MQAFSFLFFSLFQYPSIVCSNLDSQWKNLKSMQCVFLYFHFRFIFPFLLHSFILWISQKTISKIEDNDTLQANHLLPKRNSAHHPVTRNHIIYIQTTKNKKPPKKYAIKVLHCLCTQKHDCSVSNLVEQQKKFQYVLF